ncbi:phenylalanine--tRNA ligase subunit beta [Patescibacteria group bacterium]|nr:phenylalanine--tRNA ligase subunit beta [Patescibacteria group bacterium]MBU2036250.1 phenylalanine--tRNA ligase subunit beta [Patescibacteria group bacterium]
MDILIPNSWLKEFLETNATPKNIARFLSLSGPSVEKISKDGDDSIYHTEITTNRVDAVSVYGFAREASAILPRFGKKAKLLPLKFKSKYNFFDKVDYLDVEVDSKLCTRFTAVLINDVKIKDSPQFIKEKLIKIELRPINNIIDISNYIMHELGQPLHTFDYDKIKGSKMILRESKKGEKITTLDNKTFTLPGGDIVIEDGEKRLIDLCGIMGGKNSMVDKNTKNVLLFVQTYNPVKIRKTSMTLAQKSEASILFEKDLDEELVSTAMKRSIDLFEKITEGKSENLILDIYPNPYKIKSVKTNLSFINKSLGENLNKEDISNSLTPLGFKSKWQKDNLTLEVPSFRAKDIDIPEDIVEEVARIYGYYNLQSKLMKGRLPEKLFNSPFDFENKLKDVLSGFGGVEIYTYSLVPETFIENSALKLKNPLGKDTEYLRNTMLSSIKDAAIKNSGYEEPFHIFEIANIYIPQKQNLPNEKMMLAGIFSKYDFSKAKGTIEALLEKIKKDYSFEIEEKKEFLPNHRLKIMNGKNEIGEFGTLEKNDLIYYEFDIRLLQKLGNKLKGFKNPPKYPAQIEDLTFSFPERTKIGKVIDSIKNLDKQIAKIELIDTFKNSFTFRIWYQNPNKTLTNKDVESIRKKVISNLSSKFGANIK